jgi:hypothetical protein
MGLLLKNSKPKIKYFAAKKKDLAALRVNGPASSSFC